MLYVRAYQGSFVRAHFLLFITVLDAMQVLRISVS